MKEAGGAPIFLIGMRACGKTTLGQALACRLNRSFVDTDQVIGERTGSTVAEIVAREGWEGFRELEAQALRDVVQPHAVIATGGGMILRPDNREFMRQNGLCVYLEASADELWRRLQRNPKASQRPSLLGTANAESSKGAGVCLEEIQTILAEREELYRQTAHLVFSLQGKPDDIVTTLAAQCGCHTIGDKHE